MKVFKDPVLQKQFEELGYVVVPLCSEAEIEALHQSYRALAPPAMRGFHSTGFVEDAAHREAVAECVREALYPAIDKLLADYKPLICSFLMKEPQSDSALGPHQDWSFVDESRYVSVNVWCPLVDTDEDNGRLYLVPRTHLLKKFPRTAPMSYYPYGEASAEAILQQHSLPISTRSGQAIIYDNALVHYSPPNRSAEARPVAGILAIPQASKPLMYYSQQMNAPGKAGVYELDEDHYVKHSLFSPPPAERCIAEVEVGAVENPVQDLRAVFQIEQETTGRSLWDIIRKLFK